MTYFHPETDYASPWDTSYDDELAEYEKDNPMAFDPFADDDTDETAEPAPAKKTTTRKTAAKETPSVTETNVPTELSATLKAGAGYNAPWIVIRGGSIADLRSVLGDPEMRDLLEQTAKVGVFFGDQMPAPSGPAASGGSGGGQAASPRQEAPGGESRTCQHGPMQFRSGVSAKNGKAWKGFFCPTPKGTADQCAAEFLR